MNGCRFLVNLREVQNSERILQYRSLLKENINFWEEDLTSENQECATVTEDIFGTRTREIVESVTTMSLKSLLNDVDVKVVRYY